MESKNGWETNPPKGSKGKSSSDNINRLLKEFNNHILVVIGDGKRNWCWHDNWVEGGTLASQYPNLF